MHFAIYNRNFDEEDIPAIRYFLKKTKEHNITYSIYEPFYKELKQHLDFELAENVFTSKQDLASQTDFFICLGGDGTMLNAVTFVYETDIPLLGINLGRLGFLADVPKDKIDIVFQSIFNNNYFIEERSLLHLDSNQDLFGAFPFALNDFTLYRKDTSSMIKINTYLNGQFLNTYWCDGLIVATPTGSTGYSLSCNGPLVFPQSSTFVITPVSPHNLNIRPIIVPDDYVISFEVEGRSDTFLCTMDSRQESVDKTVQLAIRKEHFTIKLVKIGANNFLDTIREKLYWGIDGRN